MGRMDRLKKLPGFKYVIEFTGINRKARREVAGNDPKTRPPKMKPKRTISMKEKKRRRKQGREDRNR